MPNLPSIPDIAKQVDLNKTDILLKANIGDIPTLIGDISKSSNGWAKFSNGLIVQWGTIALNINGLNTYDVVLPISYTSSESYSASFSSSASLSSFGKTYGMSIGLTKVNQMRIGITAEMIDALRRCSWITIGY